MPNPPATAPTRNHQPPEIATRDATALVPAAPVFIRTEKDLATLEAGVLHYPEALHADMSWLIGYFLDQCRGNFEVLREAGNKVAPHLDRSTTYWSNLINGYNFQAKYPSGIWKAEGQ